MDDLFESLGGIIVPVAILLVILASPMILFQHYCGKKDPKFEKTQKTVTSNQERPPKQQSKEMRRKSVDGQSEEKEAVRNTFESIHVQPTPIKFFEAGYQMPALEDRNYKYSFDKSGCRYIYWELSLRHLSPTQDINYEVEAVYYNSDNQEFARLTQPGHLRAGWTKSWVSRGWGWDEAGRWQAGNYRVDLLIGGKKVASGRFKIFDLIEGYGSRDKVHDRNSIDRKIQSDPDRNYAPQNGRGLFSTEDEKQEPRAEKKRRGKNGW